MQVKEALGIKPPVLFTRGQSWHLGIVVACVSVSPCICVSVLQPWFCLCYNLWPIQARITKFGPEMQNTLVKITIVFRGDWLWPTRPNLSKTFIMPGFTIRPLFKFQIQIQKKFIATNYININNIHTCRYFETTRGIEARWAYWSLYGMWT